jgi:hypothetical protein
LSSDEEELQKPILLLIPDLSDEVEEDKISLARVLHIGP